MKEKADNNINWEDVEKLESIANQCIYKGKEVAEARAILKKLYGMEIEYNDDENCPSDEQPIKNA